MVYRNRNKDHRGRAGPSFLYFTAAAAILLNLLQHNGMFVQAQNDPCNVCGDAMIGSPNSVVQDPVLLDRVTCEELQFRGGLAIYNRIQCLIVQSSAFGPCGCFTEAPTMAPVEETSPPTVDTATDITLPDTSSILPGISTAPPTTSAPVITTEAPVITELPVVTEQPVTEVPATEVPLTEVPATEAPIIETAPPETATVNPGLVPKTFPPEETAAPGTEEPVTQEVSGRIMIDLVGVPGNMSDASTIDTFTTATLEFLNTQLDGTTTVVTDVQLDTQAFVAATGERLRRKLQESGTLQTTVTITGSQPNANSAEFSSLMAQLINDDPASYIDLLKSQELQGDGTYFANVETVSASDFGTSAPTTPAPAEAAPAPSGGLSTGGKVGIAIAVIVIVAVVAYGVYSIQKNKKPQASTSRSVSTPAPTTKSFDIEKGQSPKYQHRVEASPGKLGLSLRVSSDGKGAVINNIKDTSPLLGILSSGDKIINIDGIDTSKMTGADISELMVKTENQSRIIVVETSEGSYNRFTHKVVAPAGKLGLIIKVTSNGPTINQIKEGSPMTGMLSEGDVVLGIGDVNTKSMSAAEITDLMVKTSEGERTITIMSPETGASMSSTSPMKAKDAKKVLAPAGKLGLVLKTTSEGPVVHQIKDGSPMTGKLRAGDYIVGIDDVDTSKMTTNEITDLMIKTSGRDRTITFIAAASTATVASVTAAAATAATAASAATKASIPAGKTKRVVSAPPGKLGLVLKTTPEGPIVFQIKEGSPMTGILNTGDIVVAIGDVDTSSMSTQQITDVMIKTASAERQITILTSSTAPSASPAPAPVPVPAPKALNKRVIKAPKGKLGLVLKAGTDGPVVHQVKDTSPLGGIVSADDVIVAIDDVDTTKMNANEISSLMVKTQERERSMTILSEKPDPQPPVEAEATPGTAKDSGAEPESKADEAPESEPKDPEPEQKEEAEPATPAQSETKKTRQVTAKPGKLGITIDTTPNGPAVHKIKPGSQMEGLLKEGEVILSIDDVDTTQMSASAISALMVKTEDKERTLTVQSSL